MSQCWIYKGNQREETYLYVAREGDFEAVPQALMQALGALELVMSLELAPERRLARADVERVMADLASKGYFLQMPPVGPTEC